MIEQPNWTVVWDSENNPESSAPEEIPKEKKTKRTLHLKSDHSALSEGLLILQKNKMILSVPSVIKIIQKNGKISFTKDWEKLLILTTPTNLWSSCNKEILQFLYDACQNPIRKSESTQKFNEKYTFQDIKILIFLLIEKVLSLNPSIEKSIYYEIAVTFNFKFPYLDQKSELHKLHIEGLKTTGFSSSDTFEKIQNLTEDFLLYLNPHDQCIWQKETNNDEYYFKFDSYLWRSEKIDKTFLDSLTAHEKINYKKIIESFKKPMIF